jgi:predicted secreted protein
MLSFVKKFSVIILVTNLIVLLSYASSPTTQFQTLGISSKGQYVAIEEIHIEQNATVRLRVTILNTWQAKQVYKMVEVVGNDRGNDKIKMMREDALNQIRPLIEKHHINLLN